MQRNTSIITLFLCIKMSQGVILIHSAHTLQCVLCIHSAFSQCVWKNLPFAAIFWQKKVN